MTSDVGAAGSGEDARGGATQTTVSRLRPQPGETTGGWILLFRTSVLQSFDVGRPPVVAAHDHTQPVGLIRRSDLVTAYRQAVTRSLVSQQRTQLRRLLTGSAEPDVTEES